MKDYVLLLRGINVGGKNKVPMSELKKCLESLGYSDVMTYIASGNVIMRTKVSPKDIKSQIETALVSGFKLDSEIIKVQVLSLSQLAAIVDKKPSGFGDEPDKYHSDVVFLINIKAADAMKVFNPREEVDKIWPGRGVIYSQRLSRLRTKSRLSSIVGTNAYKSMTIRNWNTTVKLLKLLQSR